MAASIAWPTVWPRLRTIRRPESRSSDATTSILVLAQSKITSVIAAGSSSSISLTRDQSGSPAISAVLTTSTNPAASSSRGSVASVAGSASTAIGMW